MQKNRRSGSARVTVTLSALCAIGIILGKFLAFNVTEFMRFSLENITIIFTGIVFGPLLGAAVGAVQDLVGCLAVGYTINPIITLGSAAIGFVSGYAFRLLKRVPLPIRLALSVLPAHAIGSVLIKSIGLAVFYSLPFGVTVLWRILNYVIVGAVEISLLYILLKSQHLLSQINKITHFSIGAKFRSVSEATDFAKNTSGVFSKPGLERVSELLRNLADPQDAIKVVHIAGTNGKGSFSAMLSSILKSSGLKVGSFNSPYLYEMRESIRIGGEPISESELIALFERLRPIVDATADKPTEFELLTAAAYLKFKEEKVDVAVIECGMGGEGDATNVISAPLLSVITGISIDHTSYLGATVTEIAKKKAGIIKKACPVLLGKTDSEASAVISARARELSAPIHVTDSDPEVKEMTLHSTVLNYHGIENVHLPLLGTHQPRNAALAIKAALTLQGAFPSINSDSIRDGIAKTRWQGRFEILSHDPLFIFDGAHNIEGVRCAIESIKNYFEQRVVILSGVLGDKDYSAMADEIASVASCAVTVTPDSNRALPSVSYADVLRKRGVDATAEDSVAEGVRKAIGFARGRSTAVVCLGSLYLYREVSEALKQI